MLNTNEFNLSKIRIITIRISNLTMGENKKAITTYNYNALTWAHRHPDE